MPSERSQLRIIIFYNTVKVVDAFSEFVAEGDELRDGVPLSMLHQHAKDHDHDECASWDRVSLKLWLSPKNACPLMVPSSSSKNRVGVVATDNGRRWGIWARCIGDEYSKVVPHIEYRVKIVTDILLNARGKCDWPSCTAPIIWDRLAIPFSGMYSRLPPHLRPLLAVVSLSTRTLLHIHTCPAARRSWFRLHPLSSRVRNGESIIDRLKRLCLPFPLPPFVK